MDVLGGNLHEDQLDINHDDIEFMIDSKYETEEEFNLKHATFTETKLGNVSILHLNCRSLRANFSKICDLLQNMDQKFDVIAMSETWLNSMTDSEIYNLENYQKYTCNRSSKQGGGVMLYVKNLMCVIIKTRTQLSDRQLSRDINN